MTATTPRVSWLVLIIGAAFAALVPIDRYLTEVAGVAPRYWRVLLVLVVVALLAGRRRRPPLAPVWVLATLMIPLGGLISGQTTSVSASLTVAVELALLVGLTPWVLSYYIHADPRFTRAVAGGFLVSQGVSALVGLMQLVGLRPLGVEPVFGRSLGLAAHANVLGVMSFISIVVCLGWLESPRRRVKAVVPASVAAVNAGALIASGSISALLCAAVAVVVYAWTKRRMIRLALWSLPALGGLVLLTYLLGLGAGFVIDPVINRVDVITGTSQVDGGAASVGTRVLTYEWAWAFIQQSPLVGVGMDDTFAGTYNGITPVHNFVLHAWYQGGFIFMLWSVILVVGVVIAVLRAVVDGGSAASAAGLAGMLVFALTSAFFVQQQYWLPLLMMVSLLQVPAGHRREPVTPPVPRRDVGPVPSRR